MPQTLHLGGAVYATVDRIFSGVGQVPVRQVVDGHLIERPGLPAPPTVAYREGKGYFFLDRAMTPVTDPASVSHLPNEPPSFWRTKALEWIEKTRGKAVASLATTKKKAEREARAGRKGRRGRPGAGITDDASLHRATGGVTVEQAHRAALAQSA